jgi:hypothetical protein
LSSKEHPLLRTLEQQAWDAVKANAPLSWDMAKHLEEMAKWTTKSVDILREARKLAAEGGTIRAQQLLDEHNAARPRRRPGRPRVALPRPAQGSRVLGEVILSEFLVELKGGPKSQKELLEQVLEIIQPTT